MPTHGRLRVLAPVLCLTLLLLALPASASAWEPRVLAGTAVQITDHPYHVLVARDAFICGGAIRDATHVVTAAHCVVDEESFFPVIASPATVSVGHGDEDLDQLDVVGVSRVSVFPAYLRDRRSPALDVAVLTLEAPIDLGGATAKAVPFASETEFATAFDAGGPGFVTGWGLTAEDGQPSQFLQGVSLPLRDDDACVAEYGVDYDGDVMLCAGGEGTAPSGNPDTCQGDSGGPLVIDTDPQAPVVWELVGLVSFGNGCGRSGVPSAYAWVQSTVLRPFLEDPAPVAPPAAPTSNPTVSGTPRVGSTLTCNPPAIAGLQVTAYVWSVYDPATTGFTAIAESGSPGLTLPAATQGARLVCDARYENGGGFTYSETPGAAAVGPVQPAPAPAVTPPDTTRPSARIRRISCRRGRCTITVRASDVGGRVRSLSARLTYKVKRCRTVGGRRRCRSVTRTKRLRPRRTSTGFTIIARLKPGRYTLSAVATDTSGNRSRTARKSFRVRRR